MRVGRDPTRPAPDLTVVVVHHGARNLLDRCLESIVRGAGGVAVEIVVVDNGSPSACTLPPTSARGAARSRVERICNDRNLGFAAAANQGLARSRTPLVLFLNTDASVTGGALHGLVDVMRADPSLAAVAPMTTRPGTGASGSTKRDPRRRYLAPFTQAAGLLGLARARRPGGGARECRSGAVVDAGGRYWLEACALMVRRDALRSVGGFDEGYFFYEEDEDLCWRLRRRGYRLAVCAGVSVEHEGGASARAVGAWPVRELYRGQVRFVRRRCGGAGAALYRTAVCVAILLRAARARRRDPFALVMEGLWTSRATVSTKAA